MVSIWSRKALDLLTIDNKNYEKQNKIIPHVPKLNPPADGRVLSGPRGAAVGESFRRGYDFQLSPLSST